MLFRGQTYLVHCGTVNLPAGMTALLSPKSSIGRIDLLVRAIVDYEDLYDVVPDGCTSDQARELWIEIT